MNMKMLAVGLIGGAATMVAVVPAALAATNGSGTDAGTRTAPGGQQTSRMMNAPAGSGTLLALNGRMAMRDGIGGPINIIEAAASALGMTADELKAELQTGKSILDVASEKGVDAATLTADVTAAAKADVASKLAAGEITQEQADAATAEVDEHIADALAGVRPEGGHGGMDMRGGHGGQFNIIEAAASALGMTTDEMKTELQSGKSILDVASEKGVDAATLTANITAAAKADVASKLAAGDITQEQADRAAAEIDEHVADILSGARPEGGRGMKGDCDKDGNGAPDDAPGGATQDAPASSVA